MFFFFISTKQYSSDYLLETVNKIIPISGEFVRMETRTERGIPVTVWTYPEDVMALRYTLDHAPIIFEKQEDDLEVNFC